MDGGQWERSHGKHPQLLWMEWEMLGDPVPRMQKSSMGNLLLESWLREIRERVEADGELTKATTKIPFAGRPNSLTTGLEKLRARLRQNPDGLDEAALRERNRREALAHLDGMLRTLTWRTADCLRHEEADEQARQAAAVLPSAAELDRLLRYETKLERQMYRAMAQLERIQRMRQGETLPASLTVEVSEHG